MKFGSITTGIVSDGLVFNMDAANRASYVPDATLSYNTTNLSISGSLINDTSYIAPPTSASCWSFDGVDDYINVGNDSSIMIGTGDFTISGWMKIDGTNSGINGLIGKYGTISTGHTDYLFGITGMKLVIFVGRGGGWAAYKVGATTLSSNTWYYIACTLDRDGDATLYLNDSSDGTVAMSDPSVDISSSNTYAMGQGDGNYFDGKIGLVQLYNRSLSASDILHNYNALKGRFT